MSFGAHKDDDTLPIMTTTSETDRQRDRQTDRQRGLWDSETDRRTDGRTAGQKPTKPVEKRQTTPSALSQRFGMWLLRPASLLSPLLCSLSPPEIRILKSSNVLQDVDGAQLINNKRLKVFFLVVLRSLMKRAIILESKPSAWGHKEEEQEEVESEEENE